MGSDGRRRIDGWSGAGDNVRILPDLLIILGESRKVRYGWFATDIPEDGGSGIMAQEVVSLDLDRPKLHGRYRSLRGYRVTDLALLLVAIACELTATSLLKESKGLSRFWPTAGVVVGYLSAFALLAMVLQRLPVGPVYAIWAGLGTAGAAMIGLVVYGERLPVGGWLGVGLVMFGVVLLGMFAPHSH
jgi:small multidrug resistance pump